MISATEAQQLVNEARKKADRSAEVEQKIDAAITDACRLGTFDGEVRLVVPVALRESVDTALQRYRCNGWCAYEALRNSDGSELVLRVQRTKGGGIVPSQGDTHG